MEKDWGRNFPESWIWAQSNHFAKNNLSITASLATIPWKNKVFAGFIIGLYYKNKFFRFTTYRNAIIKDINYDTKKFYWQLEQKDMKLELTIEKGQNPGMLFAPIKTDMLPTVEEFLDGGIHCKLYQKDLVIIDDYSIKCAVEFTGDTNQLIEMVNKNK